MTMNNNQFNKLGIQENTIESIRLVKSLNIDNSLKRELITELELSLVNLEELGELI